jgi:hypothetical protein
MTSSSAPRDHAHRLALVLGGGVVVAWVLTMVLTLLAASDPQRSGALLAVFPRGTSEAQVLARVARAEGAVVQGTWFGNVWHVYGERQRFAAGLREQGALYVVPPLPMDVFGLGGCGPGV